MSIEQGLGKEVQELMANPSAEKRQEITDKISNYFGNDIFNENERKIAIDVIRLLTQDSELKVRRTLAHNLKFSKNIPHDIIFTLAQDTDDVASPILEFSSVLSQENLISIVRGCQQLAKLIAIAKRNDVSDRLSDALVDSDKEEVVKTLVSNKDAEISEETFIKTLNKFAESGVIMEAIVDRGQLPYIIVERIMSQVSDEMKNKLVEKYKINETVAKKVVDDSHEDTVLEFLSKHDDKKQITQLVEHLYSSGKLTHSIVLRALCKSDLLFFEMGLAKLSDMSQEDVHNIIFQEGVSSFSSLYKKADMPKGTFDAVNIILRFILQETKDGTQPVPSNLSNRLIEKIIEGGYDTRVNMMKYFMVLIKSKVNSIQDAEDLGDSAA